MAHYKLEGILASTIPLVESLFYRNSVPHTPAERVMGTTEPIIYNSSITPHMGNFPECFVIPAVSGFVGDYLSYQGSIRNNPFLQRVGQYFPEISALAISTYFTLGETLLPQILPGVADIKDVPAVLLSTLAGYVLAKIGRESGFNHKASLIIGEANGGSND
ncbi:MAG: hypothetical protein WCV90_03140 [Candidatus Woesearchaeota archaeon]|jgi:hypothetical protein